MKRKLLFGLGLITLLFVLSGVFILKNLNTITTNQEIKEHQEKILKRYDNILYNIKSAQAELYRHQAGYSRNIDSLVEYVLQVEDMLALTRAEYGGYIDRAACNNCHSVHGKIDTLGKILEQTNAHLAKYKEKIGLIVTLRDVGMTNLLEKEATRVGDEITGSVDSIRHATAKMNEKMEQFYISSVNHARYSIFFTVILSILLIAAIVVVMIRSITRPVEVLVKGIERVSSGDYASKVMISSDDEIGFLAQSFNAMTDNLNRMTGQKESLLKELQELNNDLEKRVLKATEELRTAHEHMLRSETLSVVGTFASGVAHELASPLSSIIGYFHLVKDRIPVEDELAKDIGLIEGELRRCLNILRGMLNFAKAPEKEKIVTDVNALIYDLLALIRYQREYKYMTIRERLDPDIPSVLAIPGQLKQVFMNIIVNACQAMSPGGELTVSTSAEDNRRSVVVRISDTGCGIPEGELNKIFQPFYTSKKTGTGLGLAVSYGIVKGHGGKIDVKSESGKGTTFLVYLPAGEDAKALVGEIF